MKRVYYNLRGIYITFHVDDRHPWPYYEGLSGPAGMHLSLLVPNRTTSKQVKEYLKKVKRERDLTGSTIYYGESVNDIPNA